MNRSIVWALFALAGACADATSAPSSADLSTASANSTTASPLAGTYVLSALGTQTAAPFEYLDLECGDGRHIQGFIYGDTLVLASDGSARRGFAIGQAYDGDAREPSHLSLAGTWQEFDPTGWDYFAGARAVGVVLASTGGLAPYRVESPTKFTTPYATGGSCVGQPTTARSVIAVYSRI
jgi:hypothetical protein